MALSEEKNSAGNAAVQDDLAYSYEITEIIGKTPDWIVRWGITLIAALLGLLLILSCVIRFPDVIEGTVEITTAPLPINLVSKRSGNVVFLKKDGEKIKAEEPVAYFLSEVDVNEVFLIEKLLGNNEPLPADKLNSLGIIQPYVSAVLTSTQAYNTFIGDKSFDLRISNLQKQSEINSRYSATITEQLRLRRNELDLDLKTFRTDSILFAQKVISETDYNMARLNWIRSIREYRSLQSSAISNESVGSQLIRQVLDLQLEKSSLQKQLSLDIANKKVELLAALKAWEAQNVFMSPIPGSLTYLDHHEDGVYVEDATSVFTVLPGERQLTAIAKLPVVGSGKLRAGQSARIRLDNYPYEQFGTLEGVVTSVALIPIEGNYLVELSLPLGLETSRRKQLVFKQKMTGQLGIITDDLKVVERLFRGLRKTVETY